MTTPTDKKCKTLAATLDLLFHIIQSITFPKAEPFKQMTAQVAAERPNQMKNPERSIGQAVSDYKRLWYSDAWKTSHQIHRDYAKIFTCDYSYHFAINTIYNTVYKHVDFSFENCVKMVAQEAK